jgi:hypothetical protein
VTDPEPLREQLIDQIAYLLDEIDALSRVIHLVPEEVLAGRPLPDDLSVKEIYGALAASDRGFFLPALQAAVAEEEPEIDTPDDRGLAAKGDWNALPTAFVLESVRAARAEVLDFLRALPPQEWARRLKLDGERCNLYEFALFITNRDTDRLRAVGERLHESRLSDRSRTQRP